MANLNLPQFVFRVSRYLFSNIIVMSMTFIVWGIVGGKT